MTSVVASQISRLGFNVSKEWVDACVEFCQSQSQNLSGQALVNVVIGQWMDADITVEGTQSGPQIRENISPEVVKTGNGNKTFSSLKMFSFPFLVDPIK